jgi:hypothetical protein
LRVGAIGNLSQDTDDFALLQLYDSADSSHLTRPQKGKGWAWRQKEITRCLLILNTAGISESERQQAVYQLGRFLSFELWKLGRIDSELKFWQKDREKFTAMIEDHTRNWGPEVVQFAKDFNKKQ